MKQITFADRDDLLEMVSQQIREVIRTEFVAFEQACNTREKPAYLDRQAAANMLHISLSTLHRLVNQKYLKCRKVGRKSLFLLSDIEKVVLTLNK